MLEKRVLGNGLTLLLEKSKSDSIAIICGVKFGSNLENLQEQGIAHFIEHLLFNGPEGTSKKKISERVDRVGGEINAFTSNEITGYYVKVLGKDFDIALKTIQDLVLNPCFVKKEIDDERKIILGEYRQLNDTPSRLIWDYMMFTLFPGHAYGRSILGTEKSLKKLSKKDFQKYFDRFYAPNNMVVSVAGNFSEKNLKKLEETFSKKKKKKISKKRKKVPAKKKFEKIEEKELMQAHFGLGFRVAKSSSRDFYALKLINAYLGGGLSGKLVQEIREKRGLAYTVHTELDANPEYGVFLVYAGIKKENVEKVKKIVLTELKKLKEKPLSETKLKNAKKYLEGKLLLGSESSLGKAKTNLEMELEEQKTKENLLKGIQKVSVKEIQKIAGKYFDEKFGFALIQPK